MNTKELIALHEKAIEQLEAIQSLQKRSGNRYEFYVGYKELFGKAAEKFLYQSKISEMAANRVKTWYLKTIEKINLAIN